MGFPVLTNLYKPNEKITLNPFYSAAILQSSFFSFFRIHRLVERRCGQVVESFGYNEHNGRLEETRKSCQRRPTKYTYAPNSHRVSEYVLYMIIILYSAPFSPLGFNTQHCQNNLNKKVKPTTKACHSTKGYHGHSAY